MITNMRDLLRYLDGVRKRTLAYIEACPEEQRFWQPLPGEYTCADIVRHIGAAEAMYMRLILQGDWRYQDHRQAQPATLAALIAELNAIHADSTSRLSKLPDSVLQEDRPSFTPTAPPNKVWRWLLAQSEHEIHHRSQLASYCTQLGVPAPHIFGVGVEELIARGQDV